MRRKAPLDEGPMGWVMVFGIGVVFFVLAFFLKPS